MEAIKTASAIILGFTVLVALIFVAVLFIEGTATVAGKVLPFLSSITNIGTVFCVVFLLPLSLFRVTRIVSIWGFFIASYLFGLCVWMYGFLVTYDLWGGGGVFIGLVLGGVGIVPLGIIAAALKGLWFIVGDLVYGIALTYGARIFALYLASKADRVVEEVAMAEMHQ
jgi:hypothetical protein